mmetsp:Transcript_65597/g.137119  ORF Transcript_65597/g.137119 Transcript_65597/m.137119 type:complete len:237 (+) Transcript_65597:541-1251(+)
MALAPSSDNSIPSHFATWYSLPTICSSVSGAKRSLVHLDWSAGMILLLKLQMRMNLAFDAYCSIIRRRANWAVLVMLSASSRMTSLGWPSVLLLPKSCLTLTKVLIWSRTTSIPRASDALSSRVIDLNFSLYMVFASAMMVEVFPVPGGPWSSMCGNCFLFIIRSTIRTMSSCATSSLKEEGRYFSTQGRVPFPSEPILVGLAGADAELIAVAVSAILESAEHSPLRCSSETQKLG